MNTSALHTTSEELTTCLLQGYDVLEDMLGTKTAAANFVSTLAQKKPKTHLPPLMARLVEVMNAHDAAVKAGNVPMELARQMDGAMLAIGSLSGTLKARVRASRAECCASGST